MSKYWFKHDHGARNDPKLQRVLIKLGHEGKSVFWDVLEMLYEQGGYLLLSECDAHAFSLHTSKECLLSLVNDFELFESDGERFWNKRILEHICEVARSSENAKAKAQKRWKSGKSTASKNDATAMLQHQNSMLQHNEHEGPPPKTEEQMLQHTKTDATASKNDATAMLQQCKNIEYRIKNKDDDGIIPSSPPNIYGAANIKSIDVLKSECLADRANFVEHICRQNKADPSVIPSALDEFNAHLRSIGESAKAVKDYRRHFQSWFKKQDISRFTTNQSPDQPTPTGRRTYEMVY